MRGLSRGENPSSAFADREGTFSHPNSGLPELGISIVEVGYIRLRWEKEKDYFFASSIGSTFSGVA
jgi:hypothetical protein